MDNSNPVQDSSVKRIRDMMSEVTVRRKQDLEFLATMASGARRVYLPSLIRRTVGDEVLEAELAQIVAALPSVPHVPLEEEHLLPALESCGEWPVSGLLANGLPIHPPGVHQAGGSAATNRKFGGVNVDRELMRRFLEYRPASDLVPTMTHVYTRGTPRGFVKRLTELTSRRVPAITKSLGLNPKTVLKRMAVLLPFDPVLMASSWGEGTWHDDLSLQLESLKTSSVSSAGPPYWVKKPQALSKLLDVVLPMVHKAISEGKIGDLYRTQPELFLGEVKNKLDRYEIAKLGDKTRPYFSLPFHWQALFSMMSQPFTGGLLQFSQKGHNAYGHSWAHGGGERVRSTAVKAKALEKGGVPLFWCYGDDVDIYYRTGGRLYNIAPDFRQMDGSVDAEVVELTIDYVVSSLQKAWGENKFFTEVGEYWKQFATDPNFLVDGKTVFRKKQEDGLMTGVVGTTLFDTMKSVLAYDEWATAVSQGRRDLLEEASARVFFKEKFGLEIKEGTWVPTIVQEDPIPDELWVPNKFLGTYLIYIQGPEKVELVPYLNEEEWTALLMCPRDDPGEFKRGRPKQAQLVTARRWFDRMRGYMVTGAFSNPLIADWIGAIVNNLDPLSIVMSVSAGGGKGEQPESAGFCNSPATGEMFEYPDSSGFPSQHWCQNLYFTPENQWDDGSWISLFPDIQERLESFHQNHKSLKPVMYVVEAARENPDKTGAVVAQQVVEYTEESGLLPDNENLERMDPISSKKEKKLRKEDKPNKRSRIVSVNPGEPEQELKRMPTATDHIWLLFQTKAAPIPFPRDYLNIGSGAVSQVWKEMYAGVKENRFPYSIWMTPVMPLPLLAQMLGRSVDATHRLAREAGLYVLGKESKFVSKIPLITGDQKTARVQEAQKQELQKRVKVVTPETTKELAVLNRKPAEPVVLDIVEAPNGIPPITGTLWRPDENPMVSLNSLMQGSGLIPSVRSRNVQVGKEQLTETELWWKNARTNSSFRQWISCLGPSSRDNIRKLYSFTLQRYNLTRSEVVHKKEVSRQSAPQVPETWAEEMEREERARFFDESGLIFTVRGAQLFAVKQLGPFLTLGQGGAASIGGIQWKQRKKESLIKFLVRTKRKLETHGYHASFQSLTTTELKRDEMHDDKRPAKPKESKRVEVTDSECHEGVVLAHSQRKWPRREA